MRRTMFNSLSLMLLLTLVSVSQSGCGRTSDSSEQNQGKSEAAKSKFTVTLTWPSLPRAETYVDAILEFRDPSGATPQNIEAIGFIPEMPSMGHGTSTQQQKFKRLGEGRIRVSNIFFSMGGAWVIKVSADIGTGADTALINVDVI